MNKQERLYLAVVGDNISVYHRPTHEFMFCGVEEGVMKQVKRIMKMSTKEFYKFLVNDLPYFRMKEESLQSVKDSGESERWYLGAWKMGTDKMLEKYNITMTYEAIPWEYIKELKEAKTPHWGTPKRGKAPNNDTELEDVLLRDDTQVTNIERTKKRLKRKTVQPTSNKPRKVSKKAPKPAPEGRLHPIFRKKKHK